MIHLPQLIQDLGIILVMAAIVTLIFKKLKQPVVLGYLIAGFFLSPHVPFILSVKDTSSVQIWAEIGVIILLFSLGLEFSFKKLAVVGKSVSITAAFEVLFMLGLGFVVGRLLGWKPMDSLFLGGILSISSTAIIVRAFDELGLKSKRFVSLVFGVLVIEDIVAILLLVLLSTVAISQSLSGINLLLSSVRLGFFLILWFIIGIYLLPALISRIRHLLSDETVVVVSLGLCLLMVIITTELGFSPALGAFVMGSLLSETKEGERIEKLLHPVRDLFAAIFFVSIGMLINPNIIFEYRYEILLITLVLICGKFMGATIGSLISGSGVRSSIQVGMSLTQIGEFSFIIATLGLALNVTSSFLYPIAVATSMITTFTTPYLIRASVPLCDWVESKLPMRVLLLLERYQAAVQSEGGKAGTARILWRAFGWRILLNTIVVTAIFLFSQKFMMALFVNVFGTKLISLLFLTLLSLTIASPFLWAISFGRSSVHLSNEDRARVDQLTIGIQLARSFLALNLIAFFVNGFLNINSAAGIIMFLVLAALLLFSQVSNKLYNNIEDHFIKSYEGKYKIKYVEGGPKLPLLTPWDVSLVEFVIHPNSKLVGLSLLNAKIKENFKVTVALVQRGNTNHMAPGRDWTIMPYDRLFIIGSDEQLDNVKTYIDEKDESLNHHRKNELFGLKSIKLTAKSSFVGKTIRDSGLRDAISGMIVGIERHGQRMLSPESSILLLDEDLLWVVGDIGKIAQVN